MLTYSNNAIMIIPLRNVVMFLIPGMIRNPVVGGFFEHPENSPLNS